MFKFLTNNRHFILSDRQNDLIDYLKRVHEMFYQHSDNENHINICLRVYENIDNEIVNGNIVFFFDVIVKYPRQYLLYAQEQPEFSMVEFELLRNEIEKTLI